MLLWVKGKGFDPWLGQLVPLTSPGPHEGSAQEPILPTLGGGSGRTVSTTSFSEICYKARFMDWEKQILRFSLCGPGQRSSAQHCLHFHAGPRHTEHPREQAVSHGISVAWMWTEELYPPWSARGSEQTLRGRSSSKPWTRCTLLSPHRTCHFLGGHKTGPLRLSEGTQSQAYNLWDITLGTLKSPKASSTTCLTAHSEPCR